MIVLDYTVHIFIPFYTDEDLKWDNPPSVDCLSIHLSVTLPLNL
uniref:Uncharacterized protein n=1 Tax=viral metagenome TaxID=1070528 RepID=A0A6C0HUQ2_9ZZZZ